jgi:hypothetical protein
MLDSSIDISPVDRQLQTVSNAVIPQNSNNRPNRKKRREYHTDLKGQLIGCELIKGSKNLDAVKHAGYNTNSRHTAHRIIRYTHAREWASSFLENRAGRMLEGLEILGSKTESLSKNIDTALETRDLNKVKALTALAKITVSTTQDLLDRAGISKITKHFSVKKNISELEDVHDVEKRILELESKLGMKVNDTAVTHAQGTGDTQADEVRVQQGGDMLVRRDEGNVVDKACTSSIEVYTSKQALVQEQASDMLAEVGDRAELIERGDGPTIVGAMQPEIICKNSNSDLLVPPINFVEVETEKISEEKVGSWEGNVTGDEEWAISQRSKFGLGTAQGE